MSHRIESAIEMSPRYPQQGVCVEVVLAQARLAFCDVTATDGITAARAKVSKGLNPVLEICNVTRLCHDPMKNGAHDTACRDFLGTLARHDTTNLFWRPVFRRCTKVAKAAVGAISHIRQRKCFNIKPDHMHTAMSGEKSRHMCIYQPCCYDDCRDLHRGTRCADNNTRLHTHGLARL